MPVEGGSALVFNGVGNQFYTTKLPFRDDCLSHETYPEPIEVPLGRGATVSALFDAARREGSGPLHLTLDRELVEAVECPRCGGREELMRPRTRVRQAEAECPTCREAGRPLVVSRIDEGTPLADRSLAEVGVPPFDVVRVDEENGDARFFLLAGDRDGLASGWGLDA